MKLLQHARHVPVTLWLPLDGNSENACEQRKRLTIPATDGSLRPSQARLMSKVCSITGSKPTRGSVIHRRGMAKKKGGVGRHVTKNVPRTFNPNLREQRVWVAELKKFVRVKVTARGLKTINKNGAYATLKKAGLIAA
ncbi:MAG TPA: 50S ribosomal protein L28 [Chthoniobacterales bacterium]